MAALYDLSGKGILVVEDDYHIALNWCRSMLGVRRSSVTDAIHILEGQKLISSTRNNLEIRDCNGLLAAAGETFGAPEAE